MLRQKLLREPTTTNATCGAAVSLHISYFQVKCHFGTMMKKNYSSRFRQVSLISKTDAGKRFQKLRKT
jgi:hypothetical protein